MRRWIAAIFFFILGCTTTQKFPSRAPDVRSFEYCDGELWGYMIPLGLRENKAWYAKDWHDPMPLMAVYLHMHSDVAIDPARALQLFVDIRSRHNIAIEIPNAKVEVQIDDHPRQEVLLRWHVVQEMKSAEEKYPSPGYEVQLINQKLNEWRVTKINNFFYFLKSQPEIVRLPSNRVSQLGTSLENISFDDDSMKQIWIRGSENIWPSQRELTNSQITVRIPAMKVNGQPIAPRTFEYSMNYQTVREKREKRSRRLCPSTSLIFERND